MKYSKILVTGGAGFIGSNLCVFFKEKYPSLKVIAFDNLKRRGSELNLSRLRERGVEFVHGDIRCPEDLAGLKDIGLLIECSAEPSVLAGYGDNPSYIINTNLTGAINCFELARKDKADVIFLSTSRVYPYDAVNAIKVEETDTRFVWKPGQAIQGWSEKGINESFTTQGPKTLYGATKLCAELLLREYLAMYGLKGVINRCGVVAGPWQFGKVDQGVFTYWMLRHYFKKDIRYIGFGGSGKQVRDVMHVDDLCRLIDCQAGMMDRITGGVFNAGGGLERSLSLVETTKLCRELTGSNVPLESCPDTRPGDISSFITDTSAVTAATGWLPVKSSRDILTDILTWIRSNETSLALL
jgi:CDP-paratose 2-epimerase